MKRYDLAIVGAGIMGLAHAFHAARAGLSVIVFERSPEASGASVRNFGMLAIAAQPSGGPLESARSSLVCWQEAAQSAGIEMVQSGCLFLAREPEEMAVLEEFAAEPAGHPVRLIAAKDLADHAPDMRPGLLGGLWSPDAWKVDQRKAMARMAAWLRKEHDVDFRNSTEVSAVGTALATSAGTFEAGHTVLCVGNEFATLFPEAFKAAGATSCQLQMMRTNPQPVGWNLKPFLLGGLSIPRYGVFSGCPSLQNLKDKQKNTRPRAIEHGVHVIACQEFDGSITIGDSHAYGGAMPDRSEEVDRLILEDLAGMIALPDPRVAQRWLGHYAHLPGSDVLNIPVAEKVRAVTMTNGQGMTHAFAIAGAVIGDLIQ